MRGRAGARPLIIGSALILSLSHDELLVARRHRLVAACPSARLGRSSALLWASSSGLDVLSLRDPEVVKGEEQIPDRPVAATRRD
jgi:hypothetical protein